MKVGQWQELFAWACQCLEDVIDRVVFLQDDVLFVDLHRSLKVDAIVEEAHQRLHVELVLHLIASHCLVASDAVDAVDPSVLQVLIRLA